MAVSEETLPRRRARDSCLFNYRADSLLYLMTRPRTHSRGTVWVMDRSAADILRSDARIAARPFGTEGSRGSMVRVARLQVAPPFLRVDENGEQCPGAQRCSTTRWRGGQWRAPAGSWWAAAGWAWRRAAPWRRR